MRYAATLILLACAALYLTGCTSTHETQARLKERQWRIASYSDGMALRSTSPQAPAAISFLDDGTIAGSPGCGYFIGSYSLSGLGLDIKANAVLSEACAPENQRQNDRLITALSNTSFIQMQKDRLLLTDLSGDPQILLVPQSK